MGETLAAAGSLALRLFITPFKPSFEIESLYSTRSEYFCLKNDIFPTKDRRSFWSKVIVCLAGQADPQQFRVHDARATSSFSEMPMSKGSKNVGTSGLSIDFEFFPTARR